MLSTTAPHLPPSLSLSLTLLYLVLFAFHHFYIFKWEEAQNSKLSVTCSYYSSQLNKTPMAWWPGAEFSPVTPLPQTENYSAFVFCIDFWIDFKYGVDLQDGNVWNDGFIHVDTYVTEVRASLIILAIFVLNFSPSN